MLVISLLLSLIVQTKHERMRKGEIIREEFEDMKNVE
jgi:hypothetical protein